MKQGWVVFVAALAGSALLAASFAIAAGRAIGPPAPRPHLRTVPDAVIAHAGYTLSAAPVPLYCGIEQRIADRAWPLQGTAACPLSQEAAVAAATRGSGSRVLESLLALIGSIGADGSGADQLAWLVVVRTNYVMTPAVTCVRGPAVTSIRCPVPVGATTLQMLDAYTGRILRFLVAA